MIKKFYRQYRKELMPFILIVIFFIGFLLGRYGKTAPSLMAIEKYEYNKTVAAENTAAVTSFETSSEEVKLKSAGSFKLTAYCPCQKCSDDYGNATATGGTAKAGRTIAVDPSVIPYGTEVIINGNTYIAEDCGAAVKGKMIDIYFNSHEEANAFGVQKAEVFLK